MTTSSEFQAAISKSVTNMDRFDQFLNGPVDTTVTTDNGSIPTLAEKLDQIDDAVASNSIAGFPGLQAALDGKAPTTHTQSIASVTGLQAALDAKIANGTMGVLTGAAGNGTTDDRAAIAAADALGPIYFPKGDYKIASNLTISNPVRFAHGAKLVVPTGVTVTFSSSIEADRFQIFSVASGGFIAVGGQSSTSVGYPEWWGAKIGDGATGVRTANVAALTACMRAMRETVLSGYYYTNGEARLDQNYRSVRGIGRDKCGMISNSATAHILNVGGVVGSYYVERPRLEGFSLSREVQATVPTSSDDDATQGHGLHIAMTSNAVVREVDTGGNLIGTYWANALSPLWEDCFDYMNGTGARCYSSMLDGSESSGFSFPSLIVFRAARIRQTNAGSSALSRGMLVLGSYTDMQVDFVETAGVHDGFLAIGSGSNAHFNSHWHDAYKGDGMKFVKTGAGGGENVTAVDCYAAPGVGATGQPFTLIDAQNVQIIAAQVASFPGGGNGKIGVLFEDCVNCTFSGMVVNHSTGVKLDNCYGCVVDVKVSKFTGTGTEGIKVQGGNANRVACGIVGVSGSVNYPTGIALAATGLNEVNLAGILDSAVTNRLTIDGTPDVGAGNRSSNYVIRPGAVITTT